ncbi:MAG: type II toxin-antitoxin system VapB family antitoxin [Methylococcales bacterium]
MRTTLNIDDDIISKVMIYTGQDNRSKAVRQALDSFVQEQKRKKLLALRGQVNIESDWEQLREQDKASL